VPPPPDLTASTCDSAPKNAGRSCSCIAASACCAGLRTSTSAEMLSSSVASIRPRVDDSTSNLVEAGGPLRSRYAAVTQPLRSLYAAVTQGMVGPRVSSSPKALTSSAIVVAIAVHSPSTPRPLRTSVSLQSRITYRKVALYLYTETLSSIRM
jgi:hypothetical protein